MHLARLARDTGHRAFTFPRNRRKATYTVFGGDQSCVDVGLVVFPLAVVRFPELRWVWKATMINYLCCFGGFVAHVVKRLVEGQGSNPLLVDILNLLDIKALRFASLGAILGLVFVLQEQFNDAFRTVSANSTVTSFIVGYTADSLLETALKRFSREVSSKMSQ